MPPPPDLPGVGPAGSHPWRYDERFGGDTRGGVRDEGARDLVPAVDPRGVPRVQPSGQSKPGQTGLLLDQQVVGSHLRGVAGRPFSLQLRVDSDEARVEIEVGEPFGGGLESRLVTLTRQGLAFWGGSYSHVKVRVDAVRSSSTVVRFQWGHWEVTQLRDWMLVEELSVLADAAVPRGARAVAGAVADPLWTWRTDQDGTGDLVVPAAVPGLGVAVPVRGARFLPTVPNVLCWEIDPL